MTDAGSDSGYENQPLRPVARGRYTEFTAVRRGRNGRDLSRARHRPPSAGRDEDRARGRRAPRSAATPFDAAPPSPDADPSGTFGELRARFLREAMVTGMMEHPGVIPVYELGQTDAGVPYYTMRFVKGSRTLRTAMNGRPDARRTAGAARAVPEGLRHARVRARPGHPPPRPQARERRARRVRRGHRPRLGPRQDHGDGGRAPRRLDAADGLPAEARLVGHADRRGRARHAGLHVARGGGGRRRPRRRAQRRLLARRPALRDPDGRACRSTTADVMLWLERVGPAGPAARERRSSPPSRPSSTRSARGRSRATGSPASSRRRSSRRACARGSARARSSARTRDTCARPRPRWPRPRASRATRSCASSTARRRGDASARAPRRTTRGRRRSSRARRRSASGACASARRRRAGAS